MSATDSENEYESADEDPENNPPIVDSNLAKGECELAENVAKKLLVVEKSDDVDKSESNAKTDRQVVAGEMGPGSQTTVSAVETSHKTTTAGLEQSQSEVIDTQPKRVTLRLEKKLQKKNQASSIESDKSEETKTPDKPPPSSSWGFTSWGTSLLSTAAASVSTFTSQVSQGIETVLETVETSLGAPPAEDLVTILKERRDQESASAEKEVPCTKDESKENKEESLLGSSSILSGVSSLTKVIESTGTRVIMGGLDTLELIGKKTIDILTEGDPGLRSKRSMFSDGTTLSQVLREAKAKTEEEQANLSIEEQEDVVNFSSFFDECQGLVHLEALEMLSSQCQTKVQGALMVTGDSEVKSSVEKISRICEELPSADETPDEETHQDFDKVASVHLKDLQLPFDLQKIKHVQNSMNMWLDDHLNRSKTEEGKNSKEVYRQAINSLAEFTAKCVEQFHKFGELILVQTEPEFEAVMCATHLTGLTSVLCVEVGSIATKFCQYLNTFDEEHEDFKLVTQQITNVYLEASNSTTYIQDAFQLLVPVIQAALLK